MVRAIEQIRRMRGAARPRGRLHLARRPHAHRLRLPPQRHTQIRASAERFTRAWRSEVAGVHCATHPRQTEIQRAHRRFVRGTLRDAGVDAVPVEGFAVWTAKLRPLIQ